jgi:hypothetical protein
MISERHCFKVGHASFAASADDLVGEVAFVGVVLDFELIFKPGDCEDISELHLLYDAVAGLIYKEIQLCECCDTCLHKMKFKSKKRAP